MVSDVTERHTSGTKFQLQWPSPESGFDLGPDKDGFSLYDNTFLQPAQVKIAEGHLLERQRPHEKER